MRVTSNLKWSARAALALLVLAAVGSGCSHQSPADAKKAFTSAPDINKLTPEQRNMVNAFSHHNVGTPAPTPATKK